MSAAATPARRLLALLEEERSLETRPGDEIRADLAVLGIDPDGPVRLARRLAERGPNPAATLLDAVIEDEAAEADIAAVESADIDQVRARLQTGTVATVTAEAQLRAGTQSNVVGIGRRRRSAVWAWTGSIVGMAACALIVVAVWWPSPDLAPLPAATVVERAAPESLAVGRIAAERSPDASAAAGLASGPIGEPEAAPPDATADVVASDPSEPPAAERIAAPSADDRARSEDRLGVAAIPTPDSASVASQPAVRDLSEEPGRPQLRSRIAPGPAVPAEADAEDSVGSAGAARREAIPVPIEDLDESFVPLPPPSTPAARRPLGGLAVEMPTETGAESAATTPTRVEIPSIEQLAESLPRGSAGSMRGLRVDVAPPGSVQSPEVADLPYVVADLALFVPWEPDLDEIRMDALLVMVDDALQNGIGDWPGAVLGRRADALRIADGMAIHALMTLRSGASDRDAILVWKQTALPPLADESLRPLLVHWFGDRASDFALITLPDR